jgi:hypothetical protein
LDKELWTPALHERLARAIFNYVADAIRQAAIVAPDRWGLTPYSDWGIRLNVGWCEVITAQDTEIALLVTREVAPTLIAGHRLTFKQERGKSYCYKRSPGSARVVVPLDRGLPVEKILKALQPALFQNIVVSARAGRSRGVKEGHRDWAVRIIGTRTGNRLPLPRVRGSIASAVSSDRARVPGTAGYFEGAVKRAAIQRIERSRAARRQCIAHYGSACRVCGFDFGATYGSLGSNFIIVHHLYPLAAATSRRKVDPYQHLRPVCANCHYMLHVDDPPLTIEELAGAVRRCAARSGLDRRAAAHRKGPGRIRRRR